MCIAFSTVNDHESCCVYSVFIPTATDGVVCIVLYINRNYWYCVHNVLYRQQQWCCVYSVLYQQQLLVLSVVFYTDSS